MPPATYSPTGITGVKAGSVLNSPTTGQVRLLAVGLQLRLSFGSARPKPAARPIPKKGPPPPAKDTISDEQYDVIERSVVFGLIGDTTLLEIQKSHLDEVADLLKQHPRIRITLTGHICSSDTETEDKKLGAARVASVAQYLQSKGIGRGRMDLNPVVESHAFEPLDLLANYQNRRVAITVQ